VGEPIPFHAFYFPSKKNPKAPFGTRTGGETCNKGGSGKNLAPGRGAPKGFGGTPKTNGFQGGGPSRASITGGRKVGAGDGFQKRILPRLQTGKNKRGEKIYYDFPLRAAQTKGFGHPRNRSMLQPQGGGGRKGIMSRMEKTRGGGDPPAFGECPGRHGTMLTGVEPRSQGAPFQTFPSSEATVAATWHRGAWTDFSGWEFTPATQGRREGGETTFVYWGGPGPGWGAALGGFIPQPTQNPFPGGILPM